MKKAIILFSGGQDSTTCLYLARKQNEVSALVNFHYGQRHFAETVCAEKTAEKLGIPLHSIEVPFLRQEVPSALIHGARERVGKLSVMGEVIVLPPTWVPGRNIIFLTYAAILAKIHGVQQVWTGVSQVDYSGYPDCRAEAIRPLEDSLRVALQFPELEIVTPLINRTKAETFALADEGGFLPEIIEDTHTCYNGDHDTFNEWGFGCGHCDACILRKRGWEEFRKERKS